jgi:hypothetical protein
VFGNSQTSYFASSTPGLARKIRLPDNLQRELDLPRSRYRRGNQTCPGDGNSVAIEDRIVLRRRTQIGMIQAVEDLHPELHVELFRDAFDGIILEERHVEVDQCWPDYAVAPAVAQ